MPRGELSFIAALRELARNPAARGFEDDCAVLPFGAETLVLTHDTMVEGVHYLSGIDPADVAWKLVSVNLSDLAAKGAKPVGVLLSYMLGGDEERFVAGLDEALKFYDVPLLGGDTVGGSEAQVLGLTAVGRATHTPVPSRGGARPGDTLYLTGPVGGAMMAFEAYRDGAGERAAYLRPLALVSEGIALAPLVTAMMDVSDGLLLDAFRLARASGVTLEIETASVPIDAPEGRRAEALRWGDDYQLLFTAPADARLPVAAHRIGSVRAASGETLVLDSEPVSGTSGLGYEHG